MPERRWRVATGGGRGGVPADGGRGPPPATTPEVDAALRQRELFGAADYPAYGRNPPSDGRSQDPRPGGLDEREQG